MKKMFDSWGSHVKKIPLQGLLCLFILCLSLPLHAQNEEGKININVKDASVKEVLEVLKKYNYRLVYSTAVIDACKKKISLDMKKGYHWLLLYSLEIQFLETASFSIHPA